MSAPGGLLMAKIIMPDDSNNDSGIKNIAINATKSPHTNIIMAAAVGASDGARLVVSIGAMLIAFVALIAMMNSLFVSVGSLVGIEDLTMQKILGWIFSPIMYLLSIPWDEAQAAGALFGEKLILNEFVAFSHLTEYLSGMSEKTIFFFMWICKLCLNCNFNGINGYIGPREKRIYCSFWPQGCTCWFFGESNECSICWLIICFLTRLLILCVKK